MPPRRYLVEGWITFSLSAASATETFTVEHGWNPELSATFWFTMVSTRPLPGSTTTTDPLYWPSDSTAARRISRSSPSMLSPSVESAYVGLVHGPPAITGGAGATGRGPATAALVACTGVTRTGVTRAELRAATVITCLIGALGAGFVAVLCAVALRCLWRTGTVPAKPI